MKRSGQPDKGADNKQMSDGDSIVRQIDEEVRRERLVALLGRFKYWIIGGVAFVLVVLVGGRAYFDARQAKFDAFGRQLLLAIEKKNEGVLGEALVELEPLLGNSSDGYEAMAKFQRAAILSAQGQNSKARPIYEQLETVAPTQNLRDLASLMWLYAALEVEAGEPINMRLEKLLRPGGTWRDSARELEAFRAVKNGNGERALELFIALTEDANAAGVRRRASEMLILLNPSQ